MTLGTQRTNTQGQGDSSLSLEGPQKRRLPSWMLWVAQAEAGEEGLLLLTASDTSVFQGFPSWMPTFSLFPTARSGQLSWAKPLSLPFTVYMYYSYFQTALSSMKPDLVRVPLSHVTLKLRFSPQFAGTQSALQAARAFMK